MTIETLMTEGQNTQVADTQQSAATQTEGQQQQAASTDDQQTQQQQQATESQEAVGQKAEGADAEGTSEDTEQKQAGAPEQYEFTAPEGKSYDPAVIGAFSEVAKKHNLTQDAAQDVLATMAPIIVARQAEQLQAAIEDWAVQSRSDKEFGGAKLEENMALAKKARDALGSPELTALLNETGFGNHPEVIRLFVRAGKAISQDSIVTGGNSSVAKSMADTLYN